MKYAVIVAITAFACYFAFNNVQLEIKIARQDEFIEMLERDKAEKALIISGFQSENEIIKKDIEIFQRLYEEVRKQVEDYEKKLQQLQNKYEQLKEEQLRETERLAQNHAIDLMEQAESIKREYDLKIQQHLIDTERKQLREQQKWIKVVQDTILSLERMPKARFTKWFQRGSPPSKRVNVSPSKSNKGKTIVIEAKTEKEIFRDKLQKLTPIVLSMLFLLVMIATAINGWIVRRRRRRLFRRK